MDHVLTSGPDSYVLDVHAGLLLDEEHIFLCSFGEFIKILALTDIFFPSGYFHVFGNDLAELLEAGREGPVLDARVLNADLENVKTGENVQLCEIDACVIVEAM